MQLKSVILDDTV